MYLTDEQIDIVGDAWDLYSTQDNGKISRNDFKSAVRECIDLFVDDLKEAR